ncbi:hypothetical protein [Streptococcus pneumoniae]|uniref:hypothetical protein n=1 Tax=Streptococcus pneumoniae TaxID=1313 RepID=UPI00102F620F|nr:hypothetical protein [Streptococcus pneumoniae]
MEQLHFITKLLDIKDPNIQILDRPEYQKRKDEICPFSSLAFFQPTTVDKEPVFGTLKTSKNGFLSL